MSDCNAIGAWALAALLGAVATGCSSGNETPSAIAPVDAGINDSIDRDSDGFADAPLLAAPIDAAVHGESPSFRRVAKRIRAMERKLVKDPSNAQLHFEFAKVLVRARLSTQSEVEVRTALRLDASLSEAAGSLVRMMLSRGELDDARAQLDSALRHGATAELYTLEAQWLRLARPSEDLAAERILALALELEPGGIEPNFELGLIHLRRNEMAESIECFEQVVALDPTHLGAQFNLARVYRMTGDNERAESAARRHQSLSRLDDLGMLKTADSLRGYGALAEMLIIAGDIKGAVAELDMAILHFPNEAQPRLTKAMALWDAGDRAAGMASFEEALDALPESVVLLHRFAHRLATDPEDENSKRRAVELAEKALALPGGRNVDVLQTVALAQLATGDTRAARQSLKHALELDPTNPGPAKMLAELNERQGRKP